jgi:hypothetical protein
MGWGIVQEGGCGLLRGWCCLGSGHNIGSDPGVNAVLQATAGAIVGDGEAIGKVKATPLYCSMTKFDIF